MGKFSLTNEERLSSRKSIEELFSYGESFLIFPLKVVWKIVDDVNFSLPAQVAFSVSKKNFKQAVKRNLLKRKMRESYRTNKNQLYGSLIQKNRKLVFMVIFIGKEIPDASKIEKSMKRVLFRLVEEVEKKNDPKRDH